MNTVNITYLGHACFMLEHNGYRIVLDPYADGTVPGMPTLRVDAEAVFCSHEHFDHNFREAVNLVAGESACTVTTLATEHDDEGGAKRGPNTVHIFDFGGIRVAHMGDIGRALKPEEIQALHGVDCLLIPVGGFFTIDPAQAKEMIAQVEPKVTVPMHFRSGEKGFPPIASIEDFTSQFDAVVNGGNCLALNENTPAQIIVLHA